MASSEVCKQCIRSSNSKTKNNTEYILKCVKNYHRLVELLIDAIEDDTEFNTEWNTSAINILNELDEI